MGCGASNAGDSPAKPAASADGESPNSTVMAKPRMPAFANEPVLLTRGVSFDKGTKGSETSSHTSSRMASTLASLQAPMRHHTARLRACRPELGRTDSSQYRKDYTQYANLWQYLGCFAVQVPKPIRYLSC